MLCLCKHNFYNFCFVFMLTTKKEMKVTPTLELSIDAHLLLQEHKTNDHYGTRVLSLLSMPIKPTCITKKIQQQSNRLLNTSSKHF